MELFSLFCEHNRSRFLLYYEYRGFHTRSCFPVFYRSVGRCWALIRHAGKRTGGDEEGYRALPSETSVRSQGILTECPLPRWWVRLTTSLPRVTGGCLVDSASGTQTRSYYLNSCNCNFHLYGTMWASRRKVCTYMVVITENWQTAKLNVILWTAGFSQVDSVNTIWGLQRGHYSNRCYQ